MRTVPPRQIFKEAPGSRKQGYANAGYQLSGIPKLTRLKNGGMGQLFDGHPIPRKGFPYDEGLRAINKTKRVVLFAFAFIPTSLSLRKYLEKIIYSFNRLIDSLWIDYERTPHYKFEYYCDFSKAIWILSSLFLGYLGISLVERERFAINFASIFEHDDAYKTPLIDLFSESSYEQFQHPSKEILRILKIFKQRSLYFDANNDGAGDKVERYGKMLAFLLKIPKFKNAFLFALREIDFKWLQYDESELYWALARNDYLVQGRTIKDRLNDQADQMVEYAKKLNPNSEVFKINHPDGSIEIKYAEIQTN